MKLLLKRAYMFVIILIVFVLLAGCAETDRNEPVESPWGITLEQYNCPIDFPSDTEAAAIADQILDGKMIVLYSLEDMLDYDPNAMDTFDWNVQYSNVPNTFQLYLQCLNPIAYLAKGYELTADENYLLQAQEILDS